MSAAIDCLEGVVNHGRRGRYIITYTGVRFWPLDPRPEEINIEDIAHSLSMLCRFNGHIKNFYSVSEHCVRVSAECRKENKLCGLLHDASEAYLCDIPTPLKQELPDYLQYEQQLQNVIYEHFGIFKETEDVKIADKVLLVTEMRDLRLKNPTNDLLYIPLTQTIVPWPQQYAKQAFLDCFNALYK